MFDKFNIFGIIGDHFKTLIRADTNSICFGDYFVLFCVPLILAFGSVNAGFAISHEVSNTLITALSILIGLLLNLLVVIYDLLNRDKPEGRGEIRLKNLVLSQTFTNISFCIVISLVAITLMIFPILINFEKLLELLHLHYSIYFGLTYRIITASVIYSSGIHLLMILKRVYRLFQFNNLPK